MTPWEVLKYAVALGVGATFILGALLFVPGVVMQFVGVCR
jgi:hypothetical protein